MRATEVISTTPIPTEKSVRGDEIRVLTSCRAGKIVPISFIPLLREDRVSRGSVRVTVDMAETVHPLMNSVNVTAFAHFIPFSALPRFPGMDAFNRSYQGEGEPHNSTPIPFYKKGKFNREAPFWKTLGIHWKHNTDINLAPLEAYNLLVNWRRAARSQKIAVRGELETSLAAAFWKNPNLWHIVPDFDQAAMDGEVELNWLNSRAPVSGLGRRQGQLPEVIAGEAVVDMVNATGTTYPHSVRFGNVPGQLLNVRVGGPSAVPNVWAELDRAGVKLSLSNIELAKKTAAFAKMREQYNGLSDDHLVDLLMEGVRVPEEALRQPILLDRQSSIFGYSERHAMDGDNLDKSVTTGRTELTLTFRTPPMNTGGIILITAEIVPEQLYERMFDQFLGTFDPAHQPNFMRDFLDPEKVDVVPNRFVDVEHATPTATFGYAPLNHAWKRSLTRIGGRYYRPNPDVFVEDRQRFWSVEQLNPSLTSDFYLVGDLPHTVFADSTKDPFEILALGNCEIVGNTVFGKTLQEDNGHYEAIAAQIDNQRINQEAP